MGQIKVGKKFLDNIVQKQEKIKIDSKQKHTIAAESTGVRNKRKIKMGHTKVEQNAINEIIQVQEEIKIDSKQEQTIAAETADVS